MTTTPPGKAPVCAVCKRVLDHYEDLEDPTLSRWIHTYQDAVDADHDPVPVDADTTEPQYRCDFCTNDESAYILPVRNFPMPGIPGMMSGDSWSACTACALLIDKNQWSALLRRTAAYYEQKHGTMSDHLLMAQRRLYWMVRANICGALRPFEGASGGAHMDGSSRNPGGV